MNLRHPPGRAGRMWLRSRLGVARRSADLLDRRRHLLTEERSRRAEAARVTEREWVTACREAERWLRRARVSGGVEQLGLATAHAARPASVELRWTSLMGVLCAEEPECRLPDARAVGAFGSTAAFDEAARATVVAVRAGARHAAARQALDAVTDNLDATLRRLRVIEHRWIPQLRETLASLELQLDEMERDDHVRLRWIGRRITRRS